MRLLFIFILTCIKHLYARHVWVNLIYISKAIIFLLAVAGISAEAKAQKGEKSIAAGVVVSVTDNSVTIYDRYQYSWGTGLGVAVRGQSNITDRSAFLLQAALSYFRGSSSYTSLLYVPVITPVSLETGYRYRFTTSGIYANGLIGFEYADHELYLPASLGVGKRFSIKENYFLDGEIQFAGGYLSRINLVAVFGLSKKRNANYKTCSTVLKNLRSKDWPLLYESGINF